MGELFEKRLSLITFEAVRIAAQLKLPNECARKKINYDSYEYLVNSQLKCHASISSVGPNPA